MKISICANTSMNNSNEVCEKLVKILEKTSAEYDIFDINTLNSGADIAFVIGGDGTILKAARFFAEYDTPIFGINLGRLGFLSQTSSDNLEESVGKIMDKDYVVEKRMMLKAGNYTALNDFVVKGGLTGRTSRFALEINDRFVCEYLADGIIVSTPTGSTAYGMAAGGPILAPEVDAIAVVPICPHTFSARPIVVSADDKIRILSVKNNEYNVSADGQVAFNLKDDLLIEKYEKLASLILLNNNDFYNVIRSKLQWGVSPAKI